MSKLQAAEYGVGTQNFKKRADIQKCFLWNSWSMFPEFGKLIWWSSVFKTGLFTNDSAEKTDEDILSYFYR